MEGIKRSNADIIILAEADGTFRSSDLDKIIVFMNIVLKNLILVY